MLPKLLGENQHELRRDGNGRFVKGQRSFGPNPTGKNGFTSIKSLIDALNKHSKKVGKDFWDYVAERASINDAVLMAILKKLLPDKVSGEGFGKDMQIIIVSPSKKDQVEDRSERIPV